MQFVQGGGEPGNCRRLQSSSVLLANIRDSCSDYLRMTGPECSRSLRTCSHYVRRACNHRRMLTLVATENSSCRNAPAGKYLPTSTIHGTAHIVPGNRLIRRDARQSLHGRRVKVTAASKRDHRCPETVRNSRKVDDDFRTEFTDGKRPDSGVSGALPCTCPGNVRFPYTLCHLRPKLATSPPCLAGGFSPTRQRSRGAHLIRS